MEPYCFQGYWCIAGKMTGYCVFECKTPPPPTKGGRSGNFRGSKKSKVRERSWTVQKKQKQNLTHPTPAGGGGGGGWGVNISKVRDISWTAEKIDKYFFTPPGGNFRGSKKQKSGKCRMGGRGGGGGEGGSRAKPGNQLVRNKADIFCYWQSVITHREHYVPHTT